MEAEADRRGWAVLSVRSDGVIEASSSAAFDRGQLVPAEISELLEETIRELQGIEPHTKRGIVEQTLRGSRETVISYSMVAPKHLRRTRQKSGLLIFRGVFLTQPRPQPNG